MLGEPSKEGFCESYVHPCLIWFAVHCATSLVSFMRRRLRMTSVRERLRIVKCFLLAFLGRLGAYRNLRRTNDREKSSRSCTWENGGLERRKISSRKANARGEKCQR